MQPRPTTLTTHPGYDVAILVLICPLVLVKKAPIVRPREPHDIAVKARRYGSNAKDRRVSESFRHQTMDRGKPIAQLVLLEATALLYQWPGDFLDPGELNWLAPQDVGIMLTTLNRFFP